MVGESEVSTGGMYGWVKEGVLEIPSLFVDMESVRQLGSPLLWVRDGQDIKIEFLSYSSVDRVCHEGKGADCFFMYTCLFAEIGIRFPFTEFECAVLRQLNYAPSQIHPNSWGFIRAFEVLMEYLQEEPSLGLFFFLFQAKGVDRGVWVTLSSHQGRTVFSLFKATYKDFKKFYVKVRSPEDAIPFFLNENLLEKFPLYWKRNPVQCLGVEELSERDACMCEFLFENLKGGKILTTSVLLKWDSNRGAVVKYLDTKVPDCSTAGLKSFFKQRAEREVSTSHVVKVEHGSEVNKPVEKRKPISLKRMRTEEVSGKRVIDLTEGRCCGRDVVLEKVVKFSRSQQGLHGFDESDSLSSLWSERYPFSIVADEHFQSKADVDLLKKTGKVAAARYVPVQAARLMCISWGLELQALEEESSQKSKKADVLELEKKLRFATEQVGLKEKENRLLKEENDELRVKIAKLSKDKKDLESRVVEVCGERKEAEVSKKAHGFEMFAAAWDMAKAQIELLVPGADLEKMDPVKVVYKGELVDDDQVPAEGSDDHNPAE
ncbi:hypothetical protein PIB30_048210 [Stylosanthes scabra]|uniref:Transposase (putative) gypsy type domain-containing protein n=1 Tax=Stylosanthes scabra TaxID=79078 RepID=A0ABU6SGW5_9FABA|nr:hypothetical protein [Stylosanthes scabra]